jgi:ribonuclease HII
VSAPFDWTMDGLKDSKELSELQREAMVVRLYKEADAKKISYYLVSATAKRIDELGAGEALRRAHLKALSMGTAGTSHVCVVDGSVLAGRDGIMSITKADTFVPQVMAASIIAKHVRDSYMKDLAEKHAGYGFERHVGYGTPEHRAAIKKLGPCLEHRMSYRPFREVNDDDGGDSQDDGTVQETA